MKTIYTLTLFFSISSCMNDSKSKLDSHNTSIVTNKNVVSSNALSDTLRIKTWLTNVITGYINTDNTIEKLKIAEEKVRSVMTKDYYDYKVDAIGMEYSDMTDVDFDTKWKKKYNTEYVGKNGIFFWAPDHGTIEVPVCRYIKSLDDTTFIFNVVIHDLDWEINHTCDITIIKKNKQFLIDDIKEY